MMVALLLPESQGELTLSSPDYHAQPAMHYNYLAEPFDRERLRAGIRLALELADRRELAPLLGKRIEPEDDDLASDEALDQWLLREATTYSHISCTCRMGPPADHWRLCHWRVTVREGPRHGRAADRRRVDHARFGSRTINPAVIMVAERDGGLHQGRPVICREARDLR